MASWLQFLAREVSDTSGVPQTTVHEVLKDAFATLKHHVLINDYRFEIPDFGVFDRRAVAHGRHVVNSKGWGGQARPGFVVRFKASRRARVYTED